MSGPGLDTAAATGDHDLPGVEQAADRVDLAALHDRDGARPAEEHRQVDMAVQGEGENEGRDGIGRSEKSREVAAGNQLRVAQGRTHVIALAITVLRQAKRFPARKAR